LAEFHEAVSDLLQMQNIPHCNFQDETVASGSTMSLQYLWRFLDNCGDLRLYSPVSGDAHEGE